MSRQLCAVSAEAFFQYRHTQEAFAALSIRNPRAEKLAREVAAESGESITEAIIRALEERLDCLKGRPSITEVADEITHNIDSVQGAAGKGPARN